MNPRLAIPLAIAVFVAAQPGGQAAGQVASGADSATVVPGKQYAPRSGMHERLLGRRYRDLWTTPITVDVLDLGRFAGGLTPVRTGGHQQTLSLRLEAADGREFNFRSVDKELTPAMPEFMKETTADWIRQDQTSAQLPAGPVVASALLDAVGVLNPGPRLVVMPDDPRLGEFREQFAGVLGTIEVHADEGPDEDQRLFEDAVRVAGTDRLLEHLIEDLDDRVDSRAFLEARLMDVLMGDWDRHERQWRWARYDRGDLRWWVAVPEDRDYAFVDYDGLLLDVTRRFGIIRMVEFGERYSTLLAMVDNSLELTQRFVGDLPAEVWDSTAAEIRSRLTDEVIANAVRQMPPSHYDLLGEELITVLQARRDALSEVAREFFLLLNEAAEVHGTDEDDELRVIRGTGTLEVRLLVGGDDAYPPRFHRTFRAEETDEVRIYLYGGDDTAIVSGSGSDIEVRIIGGEGDDRLEDASSGHTAFYDSEGDNTFVRGRDTSIDRRPWIGRAEVGVPDGPADDDIGDEEDAEEELPDGEASEPEQLIPRLARNWGERAALFAPAVGWRSAAELVVGGGPTYTRFGFRHEPYAMRLSLTGLYAPLHNRFEIGGRADLRRENSRAWFGLDAVATQMEATIFRGFGNDSPALESDAARVWHERLRLRVRLNMPRGPRWGTHVGAVAERTDPRIEPGTPAAFLPAGAADGVGRIGLEGGFRIDTRDDPIFPRSGFRAELSGIGYPPVWDVGEAFGSADVFAATYAPIPGPLPGVLAIRAGMGAALGDYPFYDAAFLGGSHTLRGFGYQRFAGDQAVFGSIELRAPLTEVNLLVRGDLGISAFADAGRVYVDGDSPGGWNQAVGGNLWFAVPVAVATVGYARGEDDRLYAHLGVPF
ncbi:MAG: BamA/TamA family outer membrane protein [Gemmatimonadota bacterium]